MKKYLDYQNRLCIILVMNATNFDKLISRMRDGDTTALQEFYEEYANRIASIAYMYLKDFHLAEDVVNEILIKIWNTAEKIHDISNPNAWICRVVKNFCLNLKNKKKPCKLIENVHMPLDTMHTIESNIHFFQLLSPLKETEQKVLILKLLAEYTFKEIATELDINQNTASKIYYRSLDKIKI